MTITHKTVYSITQSHDTYDYKVYDYNDGVNLSDDYLDDCFVANVPCYNIEDINFAMTGQKSRTFSHNTQIDLHKHIYHIHTDNHTGKKYRYLLATPQVDEYLKNNLAKMPKKHVKVVHVYNRTMHLNDSKIINCYTQDKYLSKYLTDQIEEINNA